MSGRARAPGMGGAQVIGRHACRTPALGARPAGLDSSGTADPSRHRIDAVTHARDAICAATQPSGIAAIGGHAAACPATEVPDALRA